MLESAVEVCAAACMAVLVRVDPSTFIRSRRAQLGELCMEGILDAGMMMGSGEPSMPVTTSTRHGDVWQVVGALLIVVRVRGKSRV